MKLTVILADNFNAYDSAMAGCPEAPITRTVHIELTEEQLKLISPRVVGNVAGRNYHEKFVHVFLED